MLTTPRLDFIASSCCETDISTLTLKEVRQICSRIGFCSGSVIYYVVCSCLYCDLLADEFDVALPRAVCGEGQTSFYLFCHLHADYIAEDDAVETLTHDCLLTGGLSSPQSSEVAQRGLSLI